MCLKTQTLAAVLVQGGFPPVIDADVVKKGEVVMGSKEEQNLDLLSGRPPCSWGGRQSSLLSFFILRDFTCAVPSVRYAFPLASLG